MDYIRLLDDLMTANEEGCTLEAYLTFTEDSFEKEFPLQTRTYLVSSDNERFKKGMTGGAIIGTNLDRSDQGVRLDLYMKDTGNPGGWVLEDCGLVSYQLLETCDRTPVVLGVYPNYAEANKAMLNVIDIALDGEVEEYEADETAEINEFDGWANDAGKNHSDYDWNIIRLFNDGHSIRSEADLFESLAAVQTKEEQSEQ